MMKETLKDELTMLFLCMSSEQYPEEDIKTNQTLDTKQELFFYCMSHSPITHPDGNQYANTGLDKYYSIFI